MATKIKNSYAIGDPLLVRQDTAPKWLKDKSRNKNLSFVIKAKGYDSSLQVEVLDSKTKRSEMLQALPSRYFTKGSIRSAIVRIIELKQNEVAKINADVELLQDKIRLMDDLGIDYIDDLEMEYAKRISTKLTISLKEAYAAIKE